LLYLIKKEELDIYDIPITQITEQYLEYLELMQLLDLNIAGEFLVMAATLMHIKSKMLLPPDPNAEEEKIEEDPRAELVKRLLEYKKFKEAASALSDLEKRRRDLFARNVPPELREMEPEVLDDGFEANIFDLITAFVKVVKKFSKDDFHKVVQDEFTVSQKIHDLYHMLVETPAIMFTDLFKKAKNRLEAITIFLALLELIRLNEVSVKQAGEFGDIEIVRNVKPPQIDGAAAETEDNRHGKLDISRQESPSANMPEGRENPGLMPDSSEEENMGQVAGEQSDGGEQNKIYTEGDI
jgi:segregation and condensation protein A